MNKMTSVAIFLLLLAGSFCFVGPVNASSSATPASIDCKDITSSETPGCVSAYLNSEPEPPKKHDKILKFHVGTLQDNENIIERPPAWATNLENDFSFSLKIKLPFL